MGYTHYMSRRNKNSRNITEANRKKAVLILQNIFSRYAAIITGDGNGETRQPVIVTPVTYRIWFNGIGDDAHETFDFSLTGDLPDHEFCKTARKPYDDPVMEVLIVLKHFIPGLNVRSDGFGIRGGPHADPRANPEEEWVKAAMRVRNLYGITTHLFYWEGSPKPGTELKPAVKGVPVLAGGEGAYPPFSESFRRIIRRP